jgi:hypothetical protein
MRFAIVLSAGLLITGGPCVATLASLFGISGQPFRLNGVSHEFLAHAPVTPPHPRPAKRDDLIEFFNAEAAEEDSPEASVAGSHLLSPPSLLRIPFDLTQASPQHQRPASLHGCTTARLQC